MHIHVANTCDKLKLQLQMMLTLKATQHQLDEISFHYTEWNLNFQDNSKA